MKLVRLVKLVRLARQVHKVKKVTKVILVPEPIRVRSKISSMESSLVVPCRTFTI